MQIFARVNIFIAYFAIVNNIDINVVMCVATHAALFQQEIFAVIFGV